MTSMIGSQQVDGLHRRTPTGNAMPQAGGMSNVSYEVLQSFMQRNADGWWVHGDEPVMTVPSLSSPRVIIVLHMSYFLAFYLYRVPPPCVSYRLGSFFI